MGNKNTEYSKRNKNKLKKEIKMLCKKYCHNLHLMFARLLFCDCSAEMNKRGK